VTGVALARVLLAEGGAKAIAAARQEIERAEALARERGLQITLAEAEEAAPRSRRSRTTASRTSARSARPRDCIAPAATPGRRRQAEARLAT
jgi:hypothetical protein